MVADNWGLDDFGKAAYNGMVNVGAIGLGYGAVVGGVFGYTGGRAIGGVAGAIIALPAA